MKKTSVNVVSLALAATFLLASSPASFARRQSSTSARGAKRPDAEASRWVDETLRSLSLRQRVAQLVVVAAQSEYMNFDGERFAELRRQVAEHGVGGVLVRGGSPNEV